MDENKSSVSEKKKAKEILAPVPVSADYSISADLWERLENEIISLSARIEKNEELTPDDVVNVKKLKTEVDNYVTSFNRAMREDMNKYRKIVDKMLIDIGFDKIEQFILKKRQEQNNVINERIAYKMNMLRELSERLLEKTKRLKDVPMARELLPAFMARFPKVQSGAKTNDINDWAPYFAVMSRTITIMDTFFCDPKYEDAIMLPICSGTLRELMAYARDGKEEHLANVPVKFKEDAHFIREEKLKQRLRSKADGIEYIRNILNDMNDMDGLSDADKQIRTEQTWEEISHIVCLINNL